jgi:hypothetical protein
MLEGKETSHTKPKTIKLVPRTELSKSRFAERTTWTSDICPPEPEDGRSVDWKDFLDHSRSDHNAKACWFCVSDRLQDGVTLAPSVTRPTSQDMCTFRQQAGVFFQGVWSRRKSVAARLLRLHRLSIAASASLEGGLRCEQGLGSRRTTVPTIPPVLPPLRPVSPFFVSCERWM